MALVETMRNFISIIGDKRCDTKANQKKADAWKAITSEMSISFPDRKSRFAKDYKELWRRMKNKAKGLARDKKLDINQTGGGENEKGDLHRETRAVLDLIAGELQ